MTHPVTRWPVTAADLVAGLSEGELRILRLMAEGLSNHGIGLEACLSHRTVEAHVTAIFRKLELDEERTDNRRVRAVLAYLGR
jgi:DNA-binding NarL/FixJ family response regulator